MKLSPLKKQGKKRKGKSQKKGLLRTCMALPVKLLITSLPDEWSIYIFPRLLWCGTHKVADNVCFSKALTSQVMPMLWYFPFTIKMIIKSWINLHIVYKGWHKSVIGDASVQQVKTTGVQSQSPGGWWNN